MNHLAFLAYHHGGNWSEWIAHRVVSAVIHGVIYSFIFKLMRHMSTGEAAVLVMVVLTVLFVWSRSGRPRGW